MCVCVCVCVSITLASCVSSHMFCSFLTVGTKSASYPEDIEVHPQLKTILQRRITNVTQGERCQVRFFLSVFSSFIFSSFLCSYATLLLLVRSLLFFYRATHLLSFFV